MELLDTSTRRRYRGKKHKTRPFSTDRWMSILFLVPSLIVVGVFVYGFIGWTGYVSLSKWNTLIPNFSFAGLKNYAALFSNFRFQSDLRNMLFFTVLFILAVVVLGNLLAVLLDQKVRGEAIFRNIFLFPMAFSFVVTGVVWRWVLNPSTGVNLILAHFGVHPGWYTNTAIVPDIHLGTFSFGYPAALTSVIIAAIWQMTGFSLAMYLAGLREIPNEVREAAYIDGANSWQLYTKVIIPQLKPITFGVVIMMAHVSLKIFALIYAMTGPGANFVTDMPAVNMYDSTFNGNFYAQGAAIAIIMLILVAVFIVPYLVRSRAADA